jgi:ureidoglycolate dehydrogenase (NAD+)
MATSKLAWGEVRKAERLGSDLPLESFFDNKGNWAVKPEDAHSARATGDYKGFSLALLIEILTGAMLGRLMGGVQMNKDYRTMTRGGVIIVINPGLTNSLANFKKVNTELVKNIKSTHKRAGISEILIPGERARKSREKNLKKGYLEIEKSLLEKFFQPSFPHSPT